MGNFPRLSFANHIMIEKRNVEIGKDFSTYSANKAEGVNSEKRLSHRVSATHTQKNALRIIRM